MSEEYVYFSIEYHKYCKKEADILESFQDKLHCPPDFMSRSICSGISILPGFWGCCQCLCYSGYMVCDGLFAQFVQLCDHKPAEYGLRVLLVYPAIVRIVTFPGRVGNGLFKGILEKRSGRL